MKKRRKIRIVAKLPKAGEREHTAGWSIPDSDVELMLKPILDLLEAGRLGCGGCEQYGRRGLTVHRFRDNIGSEYATPCKNPNCIAGKIQRTFQFYKQDTVKAYKERQ